MKHCETGPIDGEYWIFGEHVSEEEFLQRMPVRTIKDGVETWTLNGKLHRMCGPAVSSPFEKDEYWIFGEKIDSFDEYKRRAPTAREMGVTIRWSSPSYTGYHRTDGPAFINLSCKFKTWDQNGRLHRTDGPAVVFDPDGIGSFADGGRTWVPGDQGWYQKGQLHREDGPAFINTKSGAQEYWIKGVHVVVQEAVKDDGTYYFLGDNLHREDGPAFIGVTEEWWCIGGEFHREDGPAITFFEDNTVMVGSHTIKGSKGTKIWVQKDLLHREDGPAIIHSNGHQEWWVRGERLKVIPGQSLGRDLIIKAKWDLAIATIRLSLGWPDHPLLDLLCKVAMAAAIHHGSSDEEIQRFASDACRISLTEGGFAAMQALLEEKRELLKVLDEIVLDSQVEVL